jgi:hypothetical protein
MTLTFTVKLTLREDVRPRRNEDLKIAEGIARAIEVCKWNDIEGAEAIDGSRLG